MFSRLKYLAVAAVVAMAPLGASAATVMIDGDSLTIGQAENEFVGFVLGNGGAGSWAVEFITDTDPVDAGAFATLGGFTAGSFVGLTMSWRDAANVVLSTVNISAAGNYLLSTVFTVPNLTQSLVFNWTGSKRGTGFDVEVAATVPLPAGGLLLLGALGGIAALRRRKTA